jgi:hypothetical protein
MINSGNLLSDCEGLIEQIAFAIPTDFFQTYTPAWDCSPLLPIGNLLQSFPPEIEAIVAVDAPSYALAAAWVDVLSPRCRIRLIRNAHPTHTIESPWLQDRFHIHVPADRTTSAVLSLKNDPIAALFAQECGLVCKELEFELPGGNQLVGPGIRLVGAGFLTEPGGGEIVVRKRTAMDQFTNMDDRRLFVFGYDPHLIAAESVSIEARNARSVAIDFMEIGNNQQFSLISGARPWHQYGFHTDQYVSPTNVLRNGKPVLLVADPHSLDGRAVPLVADARKKLDLSASALIGAGFEVIRNPVPFAQVQDSRKIQARLFNNVILDGIPRRGCARPFVWMPSFEQTYPFREFEHVNAGIWNDLGYDCKIVGNFDGLASRNGAIRCISKILHRVEFK